MPEGILPELLIVAALLVLIGLALASAVIFATDSTFHRV